MADILDEFTQSPAAASLPPEPSAAPLPSADGSPSSPELESMRQELGFTRQQLSQVMSQLAQRTAAPVESGPAPASPALTTPEVFFTDDDAKMILNAPEAELPQRLNRGIRAAVEPLYRAIQERDARIEQLAHGQQQGFSQFAAQRQQEDFRNQFFLAYPDLKEDPLLVQQAVQQVSAEAQQQPWAYQQPQQLFQRVATVAQGLRQSYLQRWQGESAPAADASPETAVPSSPARRARTETGGSTRVGGAPQRSDPQHKAIDAMMASVRGR